MPTSRYILSFERFPMVFTLTYTEQKLKRIEHRKGAQSPEQWAHIQKAIPLNESNIPAIEKKYQGRITFALLETDKQASQYTQFLEVYREWHMEVFTIYPKIDGAQGNALKSIIKYLEDNAESSEVTLDIWRSILRSWKLIDEFYQRQTKLTQINSNLSNIIIQINNDTAAQTSPASRQI